MMRLYHISIILIALIVAGTIYQSVSTMINDYRYPPLGKIIDIGSCRLHINSMGAGGPTVVLDAGLGGTSLGWSLVQKEISKYTQVCSYDRAGYAWSEESSSMRTSFHIAEELHTLLHRANIPGPYILVGHSFGGSNVLLFANRYPEETAGVILVDSVHEEMWDTSSESNSDGILDQLWHHPHLQWVLSVIGCKRLMGPSEEIEKMFKPLPEQIRKMYIAQMNKTSYTKTQARELGSFAESLSQLKTANVKLQDIPLTVLTAGKIPDNEEGKTWIGLQKKLLLKSNRAKQLIAEDSDHMIHHHQPAIVIDAILEMILASTSLGNIKEVHFFMPLQPIDDPE